MQAFTRPSYEIDEVQKIVSKIDFPKKTKEKTNPRIPPKKSISFGTKRG